MWQHRQEERDLKRAENDIRRNQRELKRSLKHYELGLLTVRHLHPSTTYVCTYVYYSLVHFVYTYVRMYVLRIYVSCFVI